MRVNSVYDCLCFSLNSYYEKRYIKLLKQNEITIILAWVLAKEVFPFGTQDIDKTNMDRIGRSIGSIFGSMIST